MAKWILAELDSPKAFDVLDDTTRSGGRLIILDLTLVEVTNAIWKQFHRGLAAAASTDAAFGLLISLPCAIEPAAPRLKRALEIARAFGRSVYDALFVALAEELGLVGVTSDEPLYRAVIPSFPTICLLRNWPTC